MESDASVQKYSPQSRIFSRASEVQPFKVWGMNKWTVYGWKKNSHDNAWIRLIPSLMNLIILYGKRHFIIFKQTNNYFSFVVCSHRSHQSPILSCHLVVEYMPAPAMSLLSWRHWLWSIIWSPSLGTAI